ncbi:response regulator [Pseudomonas sp. ATCC 13867]|nr:response regulator [Pseudomonas sp. ATCC 13867]RFQ34962.1 response regulator [Pseudomonas sp. ATCC 13867]
MTSPLLMVLEDHPLPRQSTTCPLQTLDYRGIQAATNEQDALLQLRQSGGVGIVTCDAHGPGMDGLSTLRLATQTYLVKASDTGQRVIARAVPSDIASGLSVQTPSSGWS